MRARGEIPPDEAYRPRRSRRSRRRAAKSRPQALRLSLAAVVLIGIVALIGSYTFLPALMGTLFGQDVQRRLGLETTPEVNLQSQPPPNLLRGEFSEGRITLGETDFGDVRPERVTINLDPFDLNVLGSVRSGTFKSRAPLSGTIKLEISEEEVSRIADASTENVPIKAVDLEEDRVLVRSGLEVLKVDVPLSVVGELSLRKQRLVFEPQRVQAFGVPVPERLSDRLLSETDFEYPLGDLPYEARITSIEVGDDRLFLTGEMERIPVGEPDG